MAIKIVTPKPRALPPLPPEVAPDVAIILDAYPRVAEKITVMWGSVELHNYLGSTIFDERGGRQGFPISIATALLRVHDYHRTLMPKNEGDGAIWDDVL